MWDLESLSEAPPDARDFGISLRDKIIANEVDHSRLTDLVKLSEEFGHLCIPFRHHDVDGLAPNIYDTLLRHGANDIVITGNPLYEGFWDGVALVDLRDKALRNFVIDQEFFDGGFIVSTLSPLFRWIGNFSDAGFLFTEPSVVEAVFDECYFTTYCDRSADFRLEHGGDALLDDLVQKLDRLWESRKLR